jgi:hypothetical protein
MVATQNTNKIDNLEDCLNQSQTAAALLQKQRIEFVTMAAKSSVALILRQVAESAPRRPTPTRFPRCMSPRSTSRSTYRTSPCTGRSKTPSSNTVIRIGALLIVKVDDVLTICQLTAARQLRLDHEPQSGTQESDQPAT